MGIGTRDDDFKNIVKEHESRQDDVRISDLRLMIDAERSNSRSLNASEVQLRFCDSRISREVLVQAWSTWDIQTILERPHLDSSPSWKMISVTGFWPLFASGSRGSRREIRCRDQARLAKASNWERSTTVERS